MGMIGNIKAMAGDFGFTGLAGEVKEFCLNCIYTFADLIKAN